MSVQEDHHITRCSDSTIVTRPDQPLTLGIADKLYFGVIRLLDFLFQSLVKMVQLRLVIHKNYLMEELGRRPVDDAVNCSEESAPALIMKHQDDRGPG